MAEFSQPASVLFPSRRQEVGERNRDVRRRRGVTRQKIRDETDSGWRKRERERKLLRNDFILSFPPLYSYLLSDCPDFLGYSRKCYDPPDLLTFTDEALKEREIDDYLFCF